MSPEENNIAIEEATENDLEANMDIEKPSFPEYPYSIEVFRELLKNYGKYSDIFKATLKKKLLIIIPRLTK